MIDGWDPYRLLKGGAPDDEFQSEILTLVGRVPDIRSPSDAAREISSVFSRAFEPQYFTPEACSDVGALLYSRLQDAGLLASR